MENDKKLKAEIDDEPLSTLLKPQGRTAHRVGRCFEVKEPDAGDDKPEGEPGNIIHYYIEVLDNKSVALELMDSAGNPTGEIAVEGISHDDFSNRFKSCSEHDCSLQSRTIEEIKKKMSEARADMGEDHLKKGEFDEAEDKFKRSLKFNEENVRSQVGLGMTHMEQDRVDEALEIFKKISESNVIFEQSNKHTFNDFGIYLRKKGLFVQATQNYEKAILVDPYDEILYYNLGRAYWEMEKVQDAIEKIKEGLKIAREKRLKFMAGMEIKGGGEIDFKAEEKYLVETTDLATIALDRYMKKEKEMLESLFSGIDIDEEDEREDTGKFEMPVSRLLELLKEEDAEIDMESKLKAVNNLENIRDELGEEKPDIKRIVKWLKKAMENLGDLNLKGEKAKAVQDVEEHLKSLIEADGS